MKFGFNRFLRKRSLKMLNLSDLGLRSMNDLDLRYSYRFMFSIKLTASTNFDIIGYNSF